MKICIVLGTRPEIIKMCSLIRHCEKGGMDYFVIHTGQHYSYNMDRLFFEELALPQPKYHLDVGSGTHGKQTGIMLEKIENVLMDEKPSIVLVEGDTNSVLAGALAASKLHMKVGHVEAGLRSYDRSMPEEINRVITDHISDLLFVPTATSKDNALKEGIPEERIFITGNTIVDAVLQNLEISESKSPVLDELELEKGGYFLVTSHRQENVDDAGKLKGIIDGLKKVHDRWKLPVIYPIHPRTKKMLEKFGIRLFDGLRTVEPVGFLDFLQLEANARLVITDSGGVQEECCILKVPCITLRENTERPETVDVGANLLVGTDPGRIVAGAEKMLSGKKEWGIPFGDGTAAEQMIRICTDRLD